MQDQRQASTSSLGAADSTVLDAAKKSSTARKSTTKPPGPPKSSTSDDHKSSLYWLPAVVPSYSVGCVLMWHDRTTMYAWLSGCDGGFWPAGFCCPVPDLWDRQRQTAVGSCHLGVIKLNGSLSRLHSDAVQWLANLGRWTWIRSNCAGFW